MWAVIEFAKKECSVVPYSWIINDNMCYWPNKISRQADLEQLVILKKDPLPHWVKYDIVKLHHLADDCDTAKKFLDKIIEETTSTDTMNNESSALFKKTMASEESSEDEERTLVEKGSNGKKRILTDKNYTDNTKRQRYCRDLDGSSDEFSDADVGVTTITPKFNSSMEVHGGSKSGSSTPMRSSTPQDNDSRQSTSYTPSTITSSVLNRQLENPALGELFIRKLEQIIATQDQHSIILDNISRNQALVNISHLERPENLPNLPVSNKQDNRALEIFLKEELPFEYMKKRLAAIGGASVKSTVMGMLKFLLTNQVAMKFNWAGRDKRPFKGTNMLKVVKEAVRYSYRGRDDQDLTDKVIEDSVKDWLKLAKARYGYSLNRKHD